MQLGLDPAGLLLVAADEVDSRRDGVSREFSSGRLADAAGAANWSRVSCDVGRAREGGPNTATRPGPRALRLQFDSTTVSRSTILLS